MARESKIRFAIKVQNQISELFGVTERISGDLLITMKRNNFAEVGLPKNVEIKEDRFSVHVSPSSDGHTIKRTLRLGNNQIDILRNVVVPQNHNFYWPLFMKRYADLSNEIFKLKPKRGDYILLLENMNTNYNNLIIFIVISNQKSLPVKVNSRWSFVYQDFKIFRICVYFSFCPLPNFEQGDLVAQKYRSDRTDSLSILELFAAFHDLNDAITDKLKSRIFDEGIPPELSKPDFELVAEWCALRSAVPFPSPEQC